MGFLLLSELIVFNQHGDIVMERPVFIGANFKIFDIWNIYTYERVYLDFKGSIRYSSHIEKVRKNFSVVCRTSSKKNMDITQTHLSAPTSFL